MIVDVCVVCVNNDESVLVFGRVFFPPPLEFFFFLTFDQPKKSLSSFFLFRIIKISQRPTREKKKRERDRAF